MAENYGEGVAAVVLAGGASSRMGRPKAYMPFLGEPLAARVIARLRRQAAVVYFNAARGDVEAVAARRSARARRSRAGKAPGRWRASRRRWRGRGQRVCGPSSRRLATRRSCRSISSRVSSAAGAPAAVAMSAFGLEPMFALWPVAALGVVEAALASGRASPRRVLESLSAAQVGFACPGRPQPLRQPQYARRIRRRRSRGAVRSGRAGGAG